MKIEVLTTLKGGIGEMYYKGDTFTSPHIPQTILEELAEGKGKTVRVLEEDQIAPIEVVEVTVPPVAPVLAPPHPIIPKTHAPSKKHPRIKR